MLRFFISVLQTIKDIEIIKMIAKPILHLAYKVYTNPQLSQTETKVISAEIVETLQNKLDLYDAQFKTQYKNDQEDSKSIANSTFLQMYNEIKLSSEKSKKQSKIKRKINKSKDPERYKRKRLEKRQKKKEADKQEKKIYMNSQFD